MDTITVIALKEHTHDNTRVDAGERGCVGLKWENGSVAVHWPGDPANRYHVYRPDAAASLLYLHTHCMGNRTVN